MYNRYLAAAEPPDEQTPPAAENGRAAPVLSLFGRGRAGARLDVDTIIVLVIVWFLLTGDGEDTVDWEQILLIGALLLLGI